MEGLTSSAGFRIQTESDRAEGSYAFSSYSSSSVFRRIQFHPARKAFDGFANAGSDFKMETLNPSSDANSAGPSARVSGMGGKKSDGPDFFEPALDPELSFGITVRKIGAGLENLGNTCFMNSVLQCLTYTEPLAAYLQSGKHQNSCHVAGFCALCAIQKHVSRALQATGRILAPKDLVSNLRCISRNFRNSRQEDAHEYMINLLESMHKCCLPSGVPSESPGAYERSLVHRIFGGSLRSQVKCMQCSHCSNKFDPFLDLSLDIMRADSLQKAFSHFATAELLDDGARVYQCERCKQKVKAVKQLTVHKAPYVLTIHLKRFRAHDSGKIDRKVHYSSTIDMKPFVSGPNEGDLKYTLYGVLVHYGWSIHSGHYACFVRTSSGMWYSLDDNRVVQVNERTVLDQKAYMLFYVRDRKNNVPKKSVQVIQKDISKQKMTINKNYLSIPSDITEHKNGSSKAAYFNTASSTTLPKDFNSFFAPKTTLVKEVAGFQNIAKAAIPKEEPKARPVTPSPVSRGDQQEASIVAKTESVRRPDAKFTSSLDHGTHRSNLQGFANSLSNGSCSQDGASEKNNSHSSLGPFNVRLHGKPAVSSLEEASGLTSAAILEGVQIVVPSKNSSKHSQLGSTCNSESLNGKGRDEGLSEEAHKTNELKMRKPCKKSQKRRKIGAPGMHGGLKLLKLSLCLRKKKKHKRSKRSTMEKKILLKDVSLKPSTSEASSRTASQGTAPHLGKKRNLGVDLADASVVELRDRIHQNGSVIASENKDSSCPNNHRRVSSQKEMMSLLTRGLEETVVSTWDGQASSQIVEPKSESISIGYVADEWDEEYDRGKRKKIRSEKHNFGGTNPFQLLASKKSQQGKKPKRDPSVPADTAFRI